MLGLYIHVPFCDSICPYCDFSTWKAKERHHPRWFKTIFEEIKQRHLQGSKISTLYMGGGTPSELSAELTDSFLNKIQETFDLSQLQEFTLEANPNSLTQQKIEVYKQHGVTRLSLGLQSFHPTILKKLGRTHTSEQSQSAIELACKHISQVSIDLMFGVPYQEIFHLEQDIEMAMSYPLAHLSLYGLTIESNTLFHQLKNKGKLNSIRDELYDQMYLSAVEKLGKANFKRYEVSSFAKDHQISQHNSNYWNHTEYIGLGPGAHSYLLKKRIANSKKFADYERWVQNGCLLHKENHELLDQETLYSETIWLSLRTIQGLKLNEINTNFSKVPSQKKLDYWKNLNLLEEYPNNRYALTHKGWLYVDEISSHLI